METEEDEYVSIEDSENCAVDSGTNYWNTVLGPPDVVEGAVCFGTSEGLSVGEDEDLQDTTMVEEDEEEDSREPLSFELQQGFRILRELMAESNKSVNWHFLEAVDDSFPETHDYYDRIKSPMWLEKMNEKFQCRQYETITQFVSDFRLMLENCFRYNGPDHYVSKRGQRLETMLEQKLALLSRDLREKTSIAATSGQSSEDSFSASGLRRRVKSIIPHDSSALLNHLREEELKQQREQRRQVIADRKAAQEAYLHNLQEWEEQLMGKMQQTQMKAMWEIPAIGHFLFLCQEPLNLEEVAHYELEHSFMMPRQSSTMQRIMSSLLSTPFQRTKLDKKTMMPYCVWEEKLRKRLSVWYKTFNDNNRNGYKAAYKLGIDAFFFDVAGKKNPMLKKKFHELSFYRQVWILKSLCDNCLETQESLRDYMEVQPVEEQRSYVLGQDSKGNTYIHFPQFCGADLRVYRQDPVPEPEVYSSEEEEQEESEEEEEVATPPVKKRKVENGTKLVKKASKQVFINRRSGRGGQKPSDLDDTEPENTPSEVSTEPGSRSLTATPEIMEDLEEEVLSGRRTRSGRTRRNLYQNGLTQDLERSLRRLRRSRVDYKKSDRDGSPSVASDSEREYYSATDSNYNNNSVSVSDEQESGVESSRYKDKPPGSSLKAKEDSDGESRTSDLKLSGDSKDGVKTEGKCDISDMCEGNLCKKEGSCGAGQCNGHIDDKNKSAITNGDISSEELLASAVNGERVGLGTPENNKGIVHSIDGESKQDKCRTDFVNVKCEIEKRDDHATVVKSEPKDSEKGILDVKRRRASVDAESTSAQSVANGAESENASSDRKDKLKDEPGDSFKTSSASAVDANGSKETGTETVDEVKDSVASAKTEVEMEGEVKKEGIKTDDAQGVEDEEEESDELTPEIGPFELMADTVEDLRLLAEKFAEQPEPTPVSTRGKKAKAWRPPSRKRCVVDLHDRLIYLLKELEPWEPKLIQARRKAQVKMRKELDEYKEEAVKAQEVDEWNTEESSSDDTDSEMNGNTDVKEEEPKIKKSSTVLSIQSTDTRDSLMGNTEEEYELDVSSRGRLRKRRVIPNNIEDQGIKKKKLIKAGEDTGAAGHLPNILQKQLKPAIVNPMSSVTVAGKSTTYNPMQNMSASQILRMSILGQTQVKSNLISSPTSNIPLSSLGKSGVSVTQSSHPVIQSLLTTRGQQAVPTVLRQVRPRPPVIQTLKPQQSSGQAGIILQSTQSPAEKHTLEVTGGNTPSSTQKILNSLPASVIQQLLKHKAIKIQTTGPGGTTLFLTSAVPTSSVLTPPTQPQSSAQLPQPTSLTQVIKTQPVTIVSTPPLASTPAVSQPAETSKVMPSTAVSQTKIVTQTFLQQSSSTASVAASQLNTLVGPVSSLLTTSQHVTGNVPIMTSPKPVMITPQGSGQTSPKTLPTSPLLLSDTSITDHASIKPYLSPNAVSPSKQKYASNVTVKALLENRASQKVPDIQAGVSRSDVLEGVGTISSMSREVTVSKSNVNLCKVVLPSPGVQYKPRVLKIPSQEALDSALQSVVTSVSTSLPTANIKVPSPVTLPSIQPRRNVTKTIQSMKAPIPVAHKVDSSPAIRMTSPSSLTPSASQSVTSLSYTQVTKSPVKTGYVLQSPVATTNSNQKNMLLKVVPQNFLTSQGLVQGYLTPQGLVIPQNKQTIVSGTASAPAAIGATEAVQTSNHHVTLNSSTNDSVGQAESSAVKSVASNPVIFPQGGKQIQLSFSPVKQALPMSSVQTATTPVADIQQAGNKTGSKQTIGVMPALSAIQSQCSLTSATFTTASKSGKGVKSSQIQTKVATPAAELVKQIAAGQSNIHNTRMMMQPSGHVVHAKSPSAGVSALIGKTAAVSGSQAASVIPALMVGQPAVASPVSPRLFVPTQQLVGTPLQSGKAVCLTSTQELASKQPFVASHGSTLQLTGKSPTSPFVLSLGSGLQNVILSPTKDSPSQPASQVQTAALQISVPQAVAKTTNVAQSMATLQLPVQSMQLNQQVVKLTPQQLASTLQVNPQPAASGIQLVQQQVAGAATPKQILLSPQQVGNMAIPSGIKIVPQQPVASGIQTLINKAVPQVVHQKIATLQVAAGNPSENKTPVVLQQQTLPLTTNTPGQVVQLGQQQMVINKSIPQPSVVPSQSLQGSTLQPTLKIAGSLQQNQILQFQTSVSAVSAPTTISTSSLNTNKPCIQAAQPATKAALQAHLTQSKPPVLVHGAKPEMPTLSTMLGHEKGKAISTLSTTTPNRQTIQSTTDIPLSIQTSTALSSTLTTTATVNAASIKTTTGSEDSGAVVGDNGSSKQQKLLLYNIGGQLMTAQGVPVTVEQGVLKVVPQATIQIGNQMLTIRSPSSAMVENPQPMKPTTKAVSPGVLSHVPQENSSSSTAQKSASNPNVLIQTDTATAAGIVQSAIKPAITTETKLLQGDSTVTEDKLTFYSQGLTMRNSGNINSNSVSSKNQKEVALSDTVSTGSAGANNVNILAKSVKNSFQEVGQSMDMNVQPVSSASQTIDQAKPVLQKSGSREEAALNLLSLANMSER